jgi:hypothetical protein
MNFGVVVFNFDLMIGLKTETLDNYALVVLCYVIMLFVYSNCYSFMKF